MTKTQKLAAALLDLLQFAGCPVSRITLVKIAARESKIEATQAEWFGAANLLVRNKRAFKVDTFSLMAV